MAAEIKIGDKFVCTDSFAYYDDKNECFVNIYSGNAVYSVLQFYATGEGRGLVLRNEETGQYHTFLVAGMELFFSKVESAQKAFRPTEAQLKDIKNVCGKENMKVEIDDTKQLRDLPKDQQELIFYTWVNNPTSVLAKNGRHGWVACNNSGVLARNGVYKLKPEPLEVDWDIIDEKYDCVFMDKDGSVYLSNGVTTVYDDDGYWMRRGQTKAWPDCIKLKPYDPANWQFSVAIRPEK